MFNYDFECGVCGHQFEVRCEMVDRDQLRQCPECDHLYCKRAYLTAPSVQWFPGSYTYNDRGDKLDKMAKEAQVEGFRSQGEIDEAIAQAHARAKKLGMPVEKILGGTKAPFEGEIKVDPKDAATHKKLYQNYMEAGMLNKDIKKAASVKAELTAFEKTQRDKFKNARKFKPKDRKGDIAKAKAQAKNFQNQV